MEFLNSNYVLYAGLIQVINRGSAKILEADSEGVFLQDTASEAFMLATDSFENGVQWLKKYEELHYTLLVLFRKDLYDFAMERYDFSNMLDCFQAVYMSPAPPEVPRRLLVKSATAADLKIITEHYRMLSEQELKNIIYHGKLFLGYHNGGIVGFIGEHLEGSMGLLEVFPQYRGNGYGTELESFLIAHMLNEGLIPFCQVETENQKSLKLQQKLGLTLSAEHVYWLF